MNIEKREYVPLVVLLFLIVFSMFFYDPKNITSQSPDSSATICRCRISDVDGLPKGFNVINAPTTPRAIRMIQSNHLNDRTFGDREDTVVSSSECESLRVCNTETSCKVTFTVYNSNSDTGEKKKIIEKRGQCYPSFA